MIKTNLTFWSSWRTNFISVCFNSSLCFCCSSIRCFCLAVGSLVCSSISCISTKIRLHIQLKWITNLNTYTHTSYINYKVTMYQWRDWNTVLRIPHRQTEKLYNSSTQMFQKSSSHLKTVDARKVTWIKHHTEDQQILGAIVQTFVAWATWHPGFVFACSKRHQTEGCIKWRDRKLNTCSWLISRIQDQIIR